MNIECFLIIQHPETVFARLHGKNGDGIVLDMHGGMAFQPDQELSQSGSISLRFQRDSAVRQISDPAGQLQASRQIQRGIAEAYMLNPPGMMYTRNRSSRPRFRMFR